MGKRKASQRKSHGIRGHRYALRNITNRPSKDRPRSDALGSSTLSHVSTSCAHRTTFPDNVSCTKSERPDPKEQKRKRKRRAVLVREGKERRKNNNVAVVNRVRTRSRTRALRCESTGMVQDEAGSERPPDTTVASKNKRPKRKRQEKKAQRRIVKAKVGLTSKHVRSGLEAVRGVVGAQNSRKRGKGTRSDGTEEVKGSERGDRSSRESCAHDMSLEGIASEANMVRGPPCRTLEDVDKMVWVGRFLQGNTPYVVEIYKHYFAMEREARKEGPGRGPLDYMATDLQGAMTFGIRTDIVGWMLQVATKFRFARFTAYLSVNLYERMLRVEHIPIDEQQLLGCACLFLACKFEEVQRPSIKDFTYVACGQYKAGEVLQMETLILKALKYKLRAPTIQTFMCHFLNVSRDSCTVERCPLVMKNAIRYKDISIPVLHSEIQRKDRLPVCGAYMTGAYKVQCLANLFAELSLLDYDIQTKYPPSLIAAACIILARATLEISPLWSPTLEYYTGYDIFTGTEMGYRWIEVEEEYDHYPYARTLNISSKPGLVDAVADIWEMYRTVEDMLEDRELKARIRPRYMQIRARYMQSTFHWVSSLGIVGYLEISTVWNDCMEDESWSLDRPNTTCEKI